MSMHRVHLIIEDQLTSGNLAQSTATSTSSIITPIAVFSSSRPRLLRYGRRALSDHLDYGTHMHNTALNNTSLDNTGHQDRSYTIVDKAAALHNSNNSLNNGLVFNSSNRNCSVPNIISHRVINRNLRNSVLNSSNDVLDYKENGSNDIINTNHDNQGIELYHHNSDDSDNILNYNNNNNNKFSNTVLSNLNISNNIIDDLLTNSRLNLEAMNTSCHNGNDSSLTVPPKIVISRSNEHLADECEKLSRLDMQLGPSTMGLVESRPPYVMAPFDNRSVSNASAYIPVVNLAPNSAPQSVASGDSDVQVLLPFGWSRSGSSEYATSDLGLWNNASQQQPQDPPVIDSGSHRPSVNGGGGHHNNPALIRQMQLSKHKLKATSRTSALLAGFAMVAVVELEYDADTPRPLLITFAVCTTLLVSVHLLALMMSTCMLPHMEATGSQLDSPHVNLRWYIETSWFFSTCLGLLLFLLEVCVVFWIKFLDAGSPVAAVIATAILVPVFIVFIVFTLKFYRTLMKHHVSQFDEQLSALRNMYGDGEPPTPLPTPTLHNV